MPNFNFLTTATVLQSAVATEKALVNGDMRSESTDSVESLFSQMKTHPRWQDTPCILTENRDNMMQVKVFTETQADALRFLADLDDLLTKTARKLFGAESPGMSYSSPRTRKNKASYLPSTGAQDIEQECAEYEDANKKAEAA